MPFKCRSWSNIELRQFAHLFTGKVINISAWEDEDKEGKHYKDYFTGASFYRTSNLQSKYRSFTGQEDYIIDLESDESCRELYNTFDVVFNHTTLEHIYDVQKAADNLCKISKDIVILVVPANQNYHPGETWDDYWRFTKGSIREFFKRNNMSILYFSDGGDPVDGIYYFVIASKNPELWKNKIKYQNCN